MVQIGIGRFVDLPALGTDMNPVKHVCDDIKTKTYNTSSKNFSESEEAAIVEVD